MSGTVYIVGGGPGDPELITVKGLRALKKADVVVYDALVSKALLKHTRRNAELIYVGKRAGKHTLSQDEINRLLYEKALEGKIVVRLKGGDPYVFGRGEEEVEYLVKRGVKCEVIPGVTSAIAVPAYAGIPVTNRYIASSFAVVTGREAKEKTVRRVKLKNIAQAVDTLIILMGVNTLRENVMELKEVLPEDTPIAIISSGTTFNQKVIVSTLDKILSVVKDSNIKPPAIMVVGEVVKFRDKLWRYR